MQICIGNISMLHVGLKVVLEDKLRSSKKIIETALLAKSAHKSAMAFV
jgi:hypothetical protein